VLELFRILDALKGNPRRVVADILGKRMVGYLKFEDNLSKAAAVSWMERS
jgi:hypothetical protein